MMAQTPEQFGAELAAEIQSQEIAKRNDVRVDALMARDGFSVTGYLWQKPGGHYCITTMGRHRFLTQQQYDKLIYRKEPTKKEVEKALEVVALADRLRQVADDPMWAHHAEVNKSLLRQAANALTEQENVVAAARKLVAAKGRYHTALNYADLVAALCDLETQNK